MKPTGGKDVRANSGTVSSTNPSLRCAPLQTGAKLRLLIHCKVPFLPHERDIAVILWFGKPASRIESVHIDTEAGILFHKLGNTFQTHQASTAGYAEFDDRHAAMAKNPGQMAAP